MPTSAKVLTTVYGNAVAGKNLTTVDLGSITTGASPIGTLLFKFSGSAFAGSAGGTLTLNLHWSPNPFSGTNVPNASNKLLSIQTYANNSQQHLALVEGCTKINSYNAVTTYYLKISQGQIPSVTGDQTTTDSFDFCGVTVIEYAP